MFACIFSAASSALAADAGHLGDGRIATAAVENENGTTGRTICQDGIGSQIVFEWSKEKIDCRSGDCRRASVHDRFKLWDHAYKVQVTASGPFRDETPAWPKAEGLLFPDGKFYVDYSHARLGYEVNGHWNSRDQLVIEGSLVGEWFQEWIFDRCFDAN